MKVNFAAILAFFFQISSSVTFSLGTPHKSGKKNSSLFFTGNISFYVFDIAKIKQVMSSLGGGGAW